MFKTKKDAGVANPEAERYTSGDVARIAGVSLRQLQWWDERNVVSPRQEGHRRVYAQQEVVEVSVIAELRRKGFSLQKIRRVLRFLQREMGKRLGDALAENSEIHLITDGKNIYLEDEPGRIIDVLKNAKQPMFLVCRPPPAANPRNLKLRRPPRQSEPGSGNAGATKKTDRAVSCVIYKGGGRNNRTQSWHIAVGGFDEKYFRITVCASRTGCRPDGRVLSRSTQRGSSGGPRGQTGRGSGRWMLLGHAGRL